MHADLLNGPVSNWSHLTFLDLTRPNEGWVSWNDWLEVAGRLERVPKYLDFDNYAYMLEAAVAGRGIVLGWRYFIEQYLEAGTLVGSRTASSNSITIIAVCSPGRGKKSPGTAMPGASSWWSPHKVVQGVKNQFIAFARMAGFWRSPLSPPRVSVVALRVAHWLCLSLIPERPLDR